MVRWLPPQRTITDHCSEGIAQRTCAEALHAIVALNVSDILGRAIVIGAKTSDVKGDFLRSAQRWRQRRIQVIGHWNSHAVIAHVSNLQGKALGQRMLDGKVPGLHIWLPEMLINHVV